MDGARIGDEWLNVDQINGKPAWVHFTLWKSRADPLSLASSCSLTQGDLACLAEGEETKQKDEWPEWGLQWPAEIFGQNPVKWKDEQLLGYTVGQREHSYWAHWKDPGCCLLTEIYYFRNPTVTTISYYPLWPPIALFEPSWSTEAVKGDLEAEHN